MAGISSALHRASASVVYKAVKTLSTFGLEGSEIYDWPLIDDRSWKVMLGSGSREYHSRIHP